MFGLKDTRGKSFRGVVGKDGDMFLRKNGAGIVFGICQMDGRAALGFSRCKDRLMNVHSVHPLPSEFREESGMNVQNPSRPAPHHLGRQSSHVSRKDNQVDIPGGEHLKEVGFVAMLIVVCRRRQSEGFDAMLGSILEGAGMGIVADADRDPRRGRLQRGECSVERLEVRTFVRGEDGDTDGLEHRGRKIRSPSEPD